MSSPRKDSGTRLWASGFWLIGFLQIWIAFLLGQTPDAYLRGIVADSQGGPVQGAQITAVQLETGFAQTTRTDAQGEYFFGSLPRGLYSLRLSMTGYQGLEKKGIELAVGARHEENFSLSTIPTPAGQTEVNKLFQVVAPTASLPTETIASSVSVVVEENRILQLPL